ncbi:MAG: hypothetical protein H0T72_10255 [Chloroflexia bacterium]|nr:hypothetical protein [Chloroflexia bacterium]
MDYIIFGIGSSATLVLAGWLLREWGPRLRDRRPAEDEILSASDLVTRMAWARFCAACGMAILIGGALVMVVTLGAAFLAPNDDDAALAAMSVFALAAFLMLVWTGLYLRQFGAMGIIRPREKRARPEELEPRPSLVTPAPAGAGQPEPTFAETTAARGGLGRFASFFRREEEDEPAHTSAPVAGDSLEPDPAGDTRTQPLAPATSGDFERRTASPTDAVIAELSGEAGEDDEKRLSPTDPLVTSVMHPRAAGDTEPQPLIEEALAAELPVADHDHDDGKEEPLPSGDTGGNEGPIDASLDRPGHEVALAQLRRRRLSRLAHPSDTD